MLSILLSWLTFGFLCIVYGKLLIRICAVFHKNHAYGICDTFFLGTGLIGSLLSAISLWAPVNATVFWVLFSIAILYSFYLYKYKHDYFLNGIFRTIKTLPVPARVLCLLAGIAVLIYSLLPPTVYDMGLYYLQTMMWNESYKAVPGLGNIHGRFGFNSNILLLASAFSLQDIFSFRIYGILGLCIVVFSCWIVNRIFLLESFLKGISLVFFCFVFLYCYRDFISSPSSDILPNILVGYVLLRFLLGKDAIRKSPLVFWFLPVYALILKLSVLPICLFCIWIIYMLLKNKDYRQLSLFIILGLFVILPWCTRNVILTGYLVYPYPGIDLFNVDWKIPLDLVEEEKASVSSWAKMPGLDYKEVEKLSFSAWGKVWMLRHIKYMPLYILIYFLAVASPFILIYLYRKRKISDLRLSAGWLVAFCGFAFWFILAPDARFGMSFILVSALAPFLLIKEDKKIFKPFPAISLLMAAFFLYIASLSIDKYKTYMTDKALASFLYLPQSIDIIKEKNNVNFQLNDINGIPVYSPVNGFQCFDCALPCTPYLNHHLRLRGKTIQEGFRMDK